jgi:hypothetical protein
MRTRMIGARTNQLPITKFPDYPITKFKIA